MPPWGLWLPIAKVKLGLPEFLGEDRPVNLWPWDTWVLFGLYGIYAQSMIYRIKARPSWDRSSTTKRFFGSIYLGFLVVSFLLLESNSPSGAYVLLAVTLLTGAMQYLIIKDEVSFYRYLSREHPNFYQLKQNKRATLLISISRGSQRQEFTLS